MEASNDYPAVGRGEGGRPCGLEDLGDGPFCGKVRRALDVNAFGVNALVLPAGMETGFHYRYDSQEELYFVHRGEIETLFGDGTTRASATAAWRAWTPRLCARSATWATSMPCTCAPGAGTDMWGATGAFRQGEQDRVRALHDLKGPAEA